ncbi:InlB B-repeat-containing protein [Candidatus Solirubrobacter pratensis]|uniref:InlB B-repeat-containing protein n=1 Tax=Candidatus Solirubrobacter pratensis TaxID=1298857 RepID=UPI0012DDA4FC|nr:hypothetical protein [Candidatus Solirubrobacter pratensis]
MLLLVACVVPATPAVGTVPVQPWPVPALGRPTFELPSGGPRATIAAGERARQRRMLSITTEGDGQVTTGDGRVVCGRCSELYVRGSVAVVEAQPAAHSEFARWTGDCVGSATRCAVMMDRGAHVRAVFTRVLRYVDVTVSGPGTIVSQPPGIRCGASGNVCGARFGEDTVVQLSSEAASGGAFDSWGDDCHGRPAGPCPLVVGSRDDATAAFRRLEPAPDASTLSVTTLTSGTRVTSTPPGINCPPACNASFAVGTEVTLAAPFASWGGSCQGASTTCRLIVDGPTDVSVGVPLPSARSAYGVNVSVSGPGLISGGPIRCGTATGRLLDCEHLFYIGTTLVLRAVPARRFAGWSGGFCSGRSPTCSIRVTAPKTILARFRR